MNKEDIDISLLRKLIANDMFVSSKETNLSFSNGESNGWIFDSKKVLLRSDFLSAFARLFWRECECLYPFQIGGLEVGALPLLAALVLEGEKRGKKVNAFFIRKSRKKTGRVKRVEGELETLPVILIDDLLNTGGSFELQYQVLKSEFKEVNVISIFCLIAFYDKYPFFSEKNISVRKIFTLSEVQKEVPAFLHEKRKSPQVNPFPVLFAKKVEGADLSLLSERGSIAVHEKKIFFGTDSGNVYSLDKKTGSLDWVFRMPGFASRASVVASPVVLKETVFVASYNGYVVALSTKGKVLWRRGDGDSVSTEMMLDKKEKKLFVLWSHKYVPSKGELCAYDVTDGKLLWTSVFYFHATKRLALSGTGDLIILSSEEGSVTAFSISKRKVVWEVLLPLRYATSPAILPDNRLVIAGSLKDGDGACVYMLSQKNGDIIFCSDTLPIGVVSDIVFYKQTLFLASQDQTLSFFDIKKGEISKRYDLGSRILCSPTVVKRKSGMVLFVGGNDGRLHEINLENGEQKSVTYFTERLLSRVVESDGVLYVKTAGDEIVALFL